MRTIIDILKKGNSELFHSAMVSWLLDPGAEHHLGCYVLDRFAALVEEKGNRSLRHALQLTTPKIATEVGTKQSRYDIVIKAGEYSLVVENKVKSVGNNAQIEQYRKDLSVDVVGLGFHDISFAQDTHNLVPVLTYGNILQFLAEAPVSGPEDAFMMLVNQYRLFLQRELSIMAGVKDVYFGGAVDRLASLAEEVHADLGYNDNDKRYLNYIYLERLRRAFVEDEQLGKFIWATNKNMISGPWISSWQGTTTGFTFADYLTEGAEEFGFGGFWFHIQLWAGVVQRSNTDPAGMLQLKTSAKKGNRAWRDELKRRYQLRVNQNWTGKVSDGAGDFYILGECFTRDDMVSDRMMAKLKAFMQCFGEFKAAGQ